ncbi:MAG TPA: FAD-binding oxidoreductase [Solirubrobacteraceae bacterium]|nr:FAD-binding oxidoreductase [Solirubrobacteraceae bacterium]
MTVDTLVRRLSAVVGERHVLADPDVRAPFERDWTGRFGGPARLVVRPADTAEVAAVVAACATEGAAIVPQGGNTGLVGGGVPRDGEVVVSLRRLDALGDVDRAAAEVEAGGGASLAALQHHARAAGLDAGVDFAARDTASVGGLVATDAGGVRAVRHGTVRARVAGVEAVLADGSLVDRRAGLLKDNAGYDLTALLVGSEGTLGIVTRVRWRLVPLLPARVAALVPVASLGDAAALLGAVRPLLPSLESADFFLDEGLSLVVAHLRAEPPVAERAPAYVMLECAARRDPTAELAGALDAAGVAGAVVADDTAQRERLWRYREAHTEAIAAAGVPHKLDVGVPLARLAEFAGRVPGAVEEAFPGARAILFGHLGDGNVHVNVLGPPPEDEAVDEAVLRLAAACGGTISAEHGVGVAKARWLGLVRGEGELRAMRAIKDALDPAGILNPGAVLPSRGA